ncbi:hypothetical protein [Roseiflexus sp.]|uniref:hypothetical protein n=1 Tax=Roseiflexus sp. TaxID=2562120 RepID=UPI002589408B|nr:hypothetical protein [Roseiflexus sp.]
MWNAEDLLAQAKNEPEPHALLFARIARHITASIEQSIFDVKRFPPSSRLQNPLDHGRGALRRKHYARRTEKASIGMGAAVHALSYHTPSARDGIGV